ncbi:hypothetical protein ABI59_15500 [Acidobacteria bacterium Mor1]|nr:hypothetical protein ABI59_15500 [Acidobacteria bacterium Mor1]
MGEGFRNQAQCRFSDQLDPAAEQQLESMTAGQWWDLMETLKAYTKFRMTVFYGGRAFTDEPHDVVGESILSVISPEQKKPGKAAPVRQWDTRNCNDVLKFLKGVVDSKLSNKWRISGRNVRPIDDLWMDRIPAPQTLRTLEQEEEAFEQWERKLVRVLSYLHETLPEELLPTLLHMLENLPARESARLQDLPAREVYKRRKRIMRRARRKFGRHGQEL